MATPVRLDPYQNIVNVHWGQFTHVAVNFIIVLETEAGSTPGDGLPPRPADQLFYWPNYLVSSHYAHLHPDTPIAGRFGRTSNGVWVLLTEDQLDVSGIPDPTSANFSYTAFQRVGSSGGNANEGTSVSISGPDIRMVAPVGGSSLGIDVPHQSLVYKDASSVNVEHRGDDFTSGSPDYSQVLGGQLLAWAACSGATYPAPPLNNAIRYSQHEIDFSGVNCSIGDVNFSFAGINARESVPELSFSNNRVNVYVLTERE